MNIFSYQWWWSRIGGRPWTYWYRDLYHKYEIIIQAQWFWTAVLVLWLLGVSIPLKILLIGWLVYLYGFLQGHFFWGKEHIEGQEGVDDA